MSTRQAKKSRGEKKRFRIRLPIRAEDLASPFSFSPRALQQHVTHSSALAAPLLDPRNPHVRSILRSFNLGLPAEFDRPTCRNAQREQPDSQSVRSLLRCTAPPLGQFVYFFSRDDRQELAYLETRRAALPAALAAYFGGNASVVYGGNVANLTTAGIVPKVAISLSGGGNRASLFAAGALRAMDAREGSSSPLGGLLQISSYITALSGSVHTVPP